MIRVELDKQHLKLWTFVLLVFLIANVALFCKQKAELRNAAKVDGKILRAYTEIYNGEDDDGLYAVSTMTVTYFYDGKHYISDVGVITSLGKPVGKKITVYVNKEDPNTIYNPANINLTIFAIVVLVFCLISYICALTKTIVKNHSDIEIRKMLSEYDKIESSTNKKK